MDAHLGQRIAVEGLTLDIEKEMGFACTGGFARLMAIGNVIRRSVRLAMVPVADDADHLAARPGRPLTPQMQLRWLESGA